MWMSRFELAHALEKHAGEQFIAGHASVWLAWDMPYTCDNLGEYHGKYDVEHKVFLGEKIELKKIREPKVLENDNDDVEP